MHTALRSVRWLRPTVRWTVPLITALSLELSGCGHSQAASGPEFIQKPVRAGNRFVGEVRLGLGDACYVNGKIGPASYDVRDLGKGGTPAVKTADVRMLHRIMVYVHPKTLRFAYIAGEFIVFDATNGPCSGMNYFVLNGDCNEFYSPTDDFDGTRPGTGCWNPPRPWILHDQGSGTWSWSTYPNNH